MAGLSDFLSSSLGFGNAWAQDSDSLIRMAQAGDLSAYKELMRRGEMVPHPSRTPPPPQRPITRNMNRAAMAPSTLPPVERPAYLDRGISRDMSRPAAGGDPIPMDPTLTFGNRGRGLGGISLPGAEQPPYLSQPGIPGTAAAGRPDYAPATGEDAIASIANGNDAAAAIQRGASAAANDAGEVTPGAAPVPGAIGELAKAYIEQDDTTGDDPNEGYVQQILQKLMAGSDPKANRMNALAQAGFAMAASGSPYFFQAAGVGGQAGMKAYQEYQDRDVQNQMRAATLAGDASERATRKQALQDEAAYRRANLQEDVRAHQADEGYKRDVLSETKRSNDMQNQIQRQQLSITGMNAQTNLNQLKLEQDKFNESQRQYNQGLISKEKLDAAEIRLREAQAKSYESLGTSRNQKIINGTNGTYVYDMGTGETKEITNDGKPIVSKSSGSMLSDQKRAQWWVQLGLYPDEASAAKAMQQAKGWSPEKRLQQAKADAQAIVQNDYSLMADPEAAAAKRGELEAQFLQEYEDAAGSGTPSAAPPAGSAAPAPTTAPGANPYTDPNAVKRDYQAGKITKEQATKYANDLLTKQQQQP